MSGKTVDTFVIILVSYMYNEIYKNIKNYNENTSAVVVSIIFERHVSHSTHSECAPEVFQVN